MLTQLAGLALVACTMEARTAGCLRRVPCESCLSPMACMLAYVRMIFVKPLEVDESASQPVVTVWELQELPDGAVVDVVGDSEPGPVWGLVSDDAAGCEPLEPPTAFDSPRR